MKNGHLGAICGMLWAACAGFATAQESSEAPAEQLEQIVVTAERRPETIQKSSVAIQVLSAEDLIQGNVSRGTDLNALVPGLQLADAGDATQIFIRGVGDFSANALANPGVSFNIDGAYVPRPEAVNSNFYDISRVEVLKGPQGTLYGRNSTGGAINLLTNAPSLDGVSGYVDLEGGNYSLFHADAALNLPLSDTVAIRVAGNVVHRDGYLTDGTDDDEKQSGRLKVLWRPNDGFSLILTADVSHEGGVGAGPVLLPQAKSNPWYGSLEPSELARLFAEPPLGPLLAAGTRPTSNNHFDDFSAEATADLGFATLTILPAYRHADVKYLTDNGFVADVGDNSSSPSLEVRLAHEISVLNWVGGVYWSEESITAPMHIYSSPVLQNVLYQNTLGDHTYGVFGQATLTVAEGLRLIAGARYSSDERTLSGKSSNVEPNVAPPGVTEVYAGQHTFTSPTWKLGLERDLTEENMLYATASTGFKAGGLNQTIPPAQVYQPEHLTAFELGSRNRFLDNRLQVNLELFYWDYGDHQESHVTFDPAGQINFLTQNVSKATLYGADIDIQARVTPADTIKGTAEYNHTRYDSFKYQALNSAFGTPIFNPASTGCATGPVTGAPSPITYITVNCSGLPLARAPMWVWNGSFNHRFQLGNGATIDATVSGDYGSSRYLAVDFTPTELAPAYAVGNFDLTYTSATTSHSRFTVAAYVHNFNNGVEYTGGIEQPFAPPLFYANINAPRTYGGRVGYSF